MLERVPRAVNGLVGEIIDGELVAQPPPRSAMNTTSTAQSRSATLEPVLKYTIRPPTCREA
jgi:hypothetical protein